MGCCCLGCVFVSSVGATFVGLCCCGGIGVDVGVGVYKGYAIVVFRLYYLYLCFMHSVWYIYISNTMGWYNG